MFEHMESIVWDQLDHAYGRANDVPDLLRNLISKDPEVREEAFNELFSNIWHQGTIYRATSFTIPTLVELLEHSKTPDKERVAHLLSLIATGTGSHQIHRADSNNPEIAAKLKDEDECLLAIRDALAPHIEILRPYLRSPEAEIRQNVRDALEVHSKNPPEKLELTSEQRRFLHHVFSDPQLTFWLQSNHWEATGAETISEESVYAAECGIVTYPSGEVLCQFGNVDSIPESIHYMTGPVYTDNTPGFDRKLLAKQNEIRITHGPSSSRAEDPENHYSTTVTNKTNRRLKATKFAPFSKGFLGIKQHPDESYYSPTQFREWFRVPDSEGWILPGESVCDPDNYGSGSGAWVYFFEDDRGHRIIATAPLGRKI